MKKYIYSVFIIVFSSAVYSQEKMSLSMQEAIDYAIKNNYENKIASNDIRAAEKRKWETTTIGLPQISGTVDYQNWLKQQVQLADFNDDGVDEELLFGKKQSLTGTVTLSQLLFDGSYIVGLQSAKTYLKISKQAKEKTALVTKEAVVTAYGNVLVAEKSIEILKSNQKVNKRLLKGATLGYKNGLAEEEEVEQFEITKGNLENSIRNAVRMKQIAYQMLNLTLGNKIETELELTDSLENLLLANVNLNLLATDFNLNNHIDFKIAENTRESNRLLMKLEKSKRLPTLSTFINYGTAAFSDDFTFLKGSQKWIKSSLFGVSLKVPLFTSFGGEAKIAQTKIALENSDIELEQTKQRLNLQAAQARSNYQYSIENYETAKKNLNLAERIEKKHQIKFKEGVSTSFELLQAQQQLYAQQNNYVQAMLNIITNKTLLENALNTSVK